MRNRPDSSGRGPDRAAALEQYRQRASRYDTELLPFEPIRAEAIAQLRLKPGDIVLDAGCGTGLSFEGLHSRIGRRGRIVGIEQCPEMMARAQARVDAHGWNNVGLVCASASAARIDAIGNAALFHFTHDIVRDPACIGNVLGHLKPGARVVAAGLEWAPPWAWPTNGFVMLAALYSVTSLEGLGNPWSLLAQRLDDVQVRHAMMGGVFIASGVVAGGPQ